MHSQLQLWWSIVLVLHCSTVDSSPLSSWLLGKISSNRDSDAARNAQAERPTVVLVGDGRDSLSRDSPFNQLSPNQESSAIRFPSLGVVGDVPAAQPAGSAGSTSYVGPSGNVRAPSVGQPVPAGQSATGAAQPAGGNAVQPGSNQPAAGGNVATSGQTASSGTPGSGVVQPAANQPGPGANQPAAGQNPSATGTAAGQNPSATGTAAGQNGTVGAAQAGSSGIQPGSSGTSGLPGPAGASGAIGQNPTATANSSFNLDPTKQAGVTQNPNSVGSAVSKNPGDGQPEPLGGAGNLNGTVGPQQPVGANQQVEGAKIGQPAAIESPSGASAGPKSPFQHLGGSGATWSIVQRQGINFDNGQPSPVQTQSFTWNSNGQNSQAPVATGTSSQSIVGAGQPVGLAQTTNNNSTSSPSAQKLVGSDPTLTQPEGKLPQGGLLSGGNQLSIDQPTLTRGKEVQTGQPVAAGKSADPPPTPANLSSLVAQQPREQDAPPRLACVLQRKS